MRPAPQEDSECIGKGPCSSCGSSDALAHYSDGHGYCFSCQTWFQPDGEEPQRRTRTKVAADCIDFGEIKALPKRGLTKETCAKFGYSVSTYKGRPVQVAPYDDGAGNLVAQHIRFPDKDFIWTGHSKGVQLFGQNLWRDGGKKVVVTEGEIDAMTISQLQGNKWPVVSIPSGAQSAAKAFKQNLEWLESFQEVVITFDMDEPGRQAAQECAMLLTPGKAKMMSLPLKDANEMLQAGRGEEVIRAMWDAKVFRPDGIVCGTELWDEVKDPPKPGYTIPYPELQSMLNGIRKRELYLFTAGSGIGKSVFVNELGYHLQMEQGLSLGVLALEESKAKNAKRYMGIYLDKPLNVTHHGTTEEELRQAFEATVGNGKWWIYDHFGSTDIDNLIAKLRYMAVGLGVDFIVLDHISIVVSGLDEIGESERKVIDKLMTKLRSLIEETGVGVLAVVHLKRPDKGKSYNEGRQVSLTDLRGSGALEQISDVVIALERNQQGDSPNKSRIRVLKNRPMGVVGPAGAVSYNPETGRLLPDEEDAFFEPVDQGESDY